MREHVKGSEPLERASVLKRAGMPTVAVLLVTAMSMPGFWKFFDGTDQEAKVKAEVAYQLLKTQAEAQSRQIEATNAAVERLRGVVNALLLQQAGRGATRIAVGVQANAVGVVGLDAVAGVQSVVVPDLPGNLDQAAAVELSKE
jgi:hypothetical protein